MLKFRTEKTINDYKSHYIFTPFVNSYADNLNKPISADYIMEITQNICDKLSIDKKITPHSFRKSFIEEFKREQERAYQEEQQKYYDQDKQRQDEEQEKIDNKKQYRYKKKEKPQQPKEEPKTYSRWDSSNPYEVLGISENSTKQEIKKAYRNLAKIYHPDLTFTKKDEYTVILQKINRAYESLK